ncbi:hypothetical protein CR513_46634, partial [Mucuna pruriens]
MAKLLKTLELEILGKKRTWNGLKGIPRASIEDQLYQLQQEVLFPHAEDYIDLATADAFLARKDRGENHVIAVLVNTYYTLNCYHEKHGKGLRCCTSLLYLWITTHLFHNKRRATCPIEDYH